MYIDENITEWIYDEWRTRVSVGITGHDAAQQILDLVLEYGRGDELLQEHGVRLVHAIGQDGARKERAGERPSVITAVVADTTAPTIFGRRRVDVDVLQKTPSKLYALISVPGVTGWVMVGDLTHDDWVAKEHFFRLASDNAAIRADVCQKIASLVEPGKSTKDCVSEETLDDLWPEIGL